MHRRTFLSAGLGAAFLSSAAAPSQRGDHSDAQRRLYRSADLVFGTTASITVSHQDEQVARRAMAAAFDAAREIDRLLSIHRVGSQVHTLNEQGFLLQPAPHLLAVLSTARFLSALTAGAFDVTVQPLWRARGNDVRREIARQRVDWRALLFDPARVQLQRPGMAVTLNGIAQGYGADRALAALRRHGVTDALVDLGEFSGIGRPAPERRWNVGIQHPRQSHALLGTAVLERRSLATSGDYEAAFSADFSRHHIVDPKSGQSPLELASVSVAAPSAMLADGLSTALLVMGAERGMRLVRSMAQVDALFICKDGTQWHSDGFPWLRT